MMLTPYTNLPAEDAITRVYETITRYRLFVSGDRVIIGASGGPDSTCLIAILCALSKPLGIMLHLAHFNYATRGDESELDEQFVCRIAEEFSLGISIERAEPTTLATVGTGSFQSRARMARYRFFDRVASEQSASKIATGHTTNDQAETILMWIVRGTGLSGLGGIPIQRSHHIVRPLIELTRTDVLNYLGKQNIAFRTDSTNDTRSYLRNRVRLDLLPLLRRFNPKIERSIAHLASIVTEDEKVLGDITATVFKELLVHKKNGVNNENCHINRQKFLQLPLALQRRCIRKAAMQVKGHVRGMTFLHIEQIIDFILKSAGRLSVLECAGLKVHSHDCNEIVVANIAVKAEASTWEPQEFFVPGEIELQSIGCRIKSWRQPSSLMTDSITPSTKFTSRDPMVAFFDEDTFALPLTIRPWQAGDVFCPMGMGGKRKKLQDYFVDMKVPQYLRTQIPLIVASEGILWIPGYRQDERFQARSTTNRPCIMQLMR